MRTIEYVILTLFMGALVIYGANAVAGAISTSLNDSAECISNPRTC